MKKKVGLMPNFGKRGNTPMVYNPKDLQQLREEPRISRKELREETFYTLNAEFCFAYLRHSLRQSFNYHGKAAPQEFWWFLAWNILLFVLCLKAEENWGITWQFYSFCLVPVPLVALLVRRMNDIGYSRWWLVCLPVTFALFGIKGTSFDGVLTWSLIGVFLSEMGIFLFFVSYPGTRWI